MSQPLPRLRTVLSQYDFKKPRFGEGVLTRNVSAEQLAQLPDPELLLQNLARSVFETMAGIREVEQMNRWLAPDVFSKLLAHVQHTARARKRLGAVLQRPYIATRRCIWQSPCPGVVEATVIVDLGKRCRAVAIRLEVYRDRWRAERLSVL